MSKQMTQEELVQKLCETGEAMKLELLNLVEAGEDAGCQMREEKDAIEAWESTVELTDFIWQKKIISEDCEIPDGLRNL